MTLEPFAAVLIGVGLVVAIGLIAWAIRNDEEAE